MCVDSFHRKPSKCSKRYNGNTLIRSHVMKKSNSLNQHAKVYGLYTKHLEYQIFSIKRLVSDANLCLRGKHPIYANA